MDRTHRNKRLNPWWGLNLTLAPLGSYQMIGMKAVTIF